MPWNRRRFGLILRGIFSEKFADSGDIRPVSPEKSSRFKGPDPRFRHKIICINNNAGVHTIRFFRRDMYALSYILQNFGNHLTRGRCICLHIGEGCIFYHFRSLPVMVQNHNGFAQPQQLRAFRDAGFIYIHYHQHRIASRHLYSLLAAYDHILFVFLMALEQIHDWL